MMNFFVFDFSFLLLFVFFIGNSKHRFGFVGAFSTTSRIPSSRRQLAYYYSYKLQDNQRPVSAKHRTGRSTALLQSSNYGRGAEIWPPANEEPIRLENSFPNGVLPDNVLDKINSLSAATGPSAATAISTSSSSSAEEEDHGGNKAPLLRRISAPPRAIGRILRRAASAQEVSESEGPPGVGGGGVMDRTPMILATALVVTGMIRPLDALLVSFLSGYFIILFLWARSLRLDGITPLMPSLPPQGHVPNLVSNPLGPNYSMNYQYWLKTGALVGLFAPLGLLARYSINQQLDCSRACARPIFFMCCQAISEAIGRKSLTPLPIRILIPLAYNTIRIGYLWHWAFLPVQLGRVGRAVAVANLTYWMANLFGFLIPVAAVRYMRAHFFAVEAEQVTTRTSMDSAGLMF